MVNEQKLKGEFEASEDLQIEFGDDFGAFFALKKHEDEVRKKDERRARRRENRPRDVEVDESQLRAEFAASKNLQDEFSGVDSYVEFRRAGAGGKIRTCAGGSLTSAPGQKKTEKKISGKESHISEPVKNTFQAARREKEIQEADELEQYRFGLPCDENGVVCA